jgi:hypothetical protein
MASMSRVDSELRQSEAFSRQNPQRSPVHQNLFNIWDRQHSCISIKLELSFSVRDESIASPADVYDVGRQDSTSTEMYCWLSVIVLFRGKVRVSVFASRWIVKDCVNRTTIRHASNHGCETDGNNRWIGSSAIAQDWRTPAKCIYVAELGCCFCRAGHNRKVILVFQFSSGL